jgi:hypothetical protein
MMDRGQGGLVQTVAQRHAPPGTGRAAGGRSNGMAEAGIVLVAPGIDGRRDGAGIGQGLRRQPQVRPVRAINPTCSNRPSRSRMAVRSGEPSRFATPWLHARNRPCPALLQRAAMKAARRCEPTRADRLMPCPRILGVLEQAVGKALIALAPRPITMSAGSSVKPWKLRRSRPFAAALASGSWPCAKWSKPMAR